jgi:hypothetical protein
VLSVLAGGGRWGRAPERRRHPQLLPAFRDDKKRIASHPFRVLHLSNVLNLLVEFSLIEDIALGGHTFGVGIGLTSEMVDARVELRFCDRVRGVTTLGYLRNPLRRLAPASL